MSREWSRSRAPPRPHDLNLTIDAEEADRLELSLDIFARVLADPDLDGVERLRPCGAGLSEARAGGDRLGQSPPPARLGRRVMVRLVKGAYWDTEVKRAQERGLADYPVFSRKAMTDLCYMTCARKLLAARPLIYPQIATHNALTVASVIEAAGGVEGYEFQRLYGMGEALYEALLREEPQAACRVYAPVGGHRDLLAYLVRRLLENGANSSFVYAAADPNVPLADHPRAPARGDRRPPAGPPPENSAAAAISTVPERKNSSGVEFGHAASLEALLAEVARRAAAAADAPRRVIDGMRSAPAAAGRCFRPIDGARHRHGQRRRRGPIARVRGRRRRGRLSGLGRDTAANTCRARSIAPAICSSDDRGRLIALLQAEGGKTLDDAVAEVREAADLCRYYAAEARRGLASERDAGADRRKR